jgi:hypothetical protein
MDQDIKNKIWFAGFYEGEGSVSNDIHNRNKIRLNISQNDKTPLVLGQTIWGGTIRERIRITPSGKTCYGNEWVLNHNQALTFIKDIKEYMIIPYKIQQIDKVIEKSNEIWSRRFKCSFVKTIFQIHREEEDTRKHNTMKMEADTNVPSAKTNIYLWIQ